MCETGPTSLNSANSTLVTCTCVVPCASSKRPRGSADRVGQRRIIFEVGFRETTKRSSTLRPASGRREVSEPSQPVCVCLLLCFFLPSTRSAFSILILHAVTAWDVDELDFRHWAVGCFLHHILLHSPAKEMLANAIGW